MFSLDKGIKALEVREREKYRKIRITLSHHGIALKYVSVFRMEDLGSVSFPI
jgi:hypothetical protein